MDDFDFFTFRYTSTRCASSVIQIILTTCSSPVKGIDTVLEVLSANEIGSTTDKCHTHSIIYTNMSINTLRARLKQAFKLKGNESYSLKRVDNLESALSYTVKDGDYCYSPKWESIRPIDQIEPWIDFGKSIDDQVKELDQNYLDSGMDDDSYLESLLTIYSSKNSLYIHHIRSHWLALYNRRNRLGVVRHYFDPENPDHNYTERQVNPRQLLVSLIKNIVIH